MIKNKIILFCFLVLLFSCSKEELVETEITDETCLSDDEFNNEFIMQAQVFFENEVKNSVDTCTNKGNESSARKLIEKNLLWEQAYVKELSFGTGIVIPVKYETELYVPKGSSSVTLSQLTYVLIYLNHQGKMKAELVSTLPDEAYCSSDSSDLPFTGLVMVEDWHGNYIKGFWHKEGQIENIRLKEGNNKTDSETCIVTEYYDCVSYDGGYFWTCSLYDYDQTCFSGTGGLGGEEYTPGGGGSNTGNKPSIPNDLSATELELLNMAKIKLLTGYCANNKVINSVWSSLKFKINPKLGYDAKYYPSSNTIEFLNGSSISNTTVLEEVFHAYQNVFYSGGTEQYLNEGKVNIEFEACLYRDLWAIVADEPLKLERMLPLNLRRSYKVWITEIQAFGFTEKSLEDYSYWLEKFGNCFPDYNTPTNSNLNKPYAAMSSFACFNNDISD